MNPLPSEAHNDGIVTRHTDIDPNRVIPRLSQLAISPAAVLPPVDWKDIGAAPVHLPLGARRPEDPLPFADVAILTWTSTEWFAFDHVFLNSGVAGNPNDYDWQKAWLPYSHGASAYSTDLPSAPLWGSFQLVQITDRSGRPWRVLLFKSNTHLAYAPWAAGLTAMVRCILEDTQTDRIYSIGTAGGARPDQHLGDAIITNAALLDLQQPGNTTGDSDNGNLYRCPTWFPATTLLGDVERVLLYRMNQIVTPQSLQDLFTQLKTKHPDDPGLAELGLADLLNNTLRPERLGSPKVRALRDAPLLTTDFFHIAAAGNNAEAYACLEMDDAIIAREANRLGVRFACVRNISDPAVRNRTDKGTPISDAVRADWSGLIYTTFGLQTSYNGALATWATIAGEGSPVYNPPRHTKPQEMDDPLEVKLAFQVRSCGSCSFFWPQEKSQQPYGPYTAFDFDLNVPYPATPSSGLAPSPWVTGRTRPPAFPNPEVIDGCRKAPIMTIGINPNLTSFLPGQTGAAWCYPNFSSDNATDAWAKYAWYYRYRTVYQERLTLDFAKKFILPEGQIVALHNGHIVSASRLDDSPAWTIAVRYDGDAVDTVISLPGKTGDFPYVLLFDPYAGAKGFAAGEVIAGRIAVPQGIQVEVMQQQQGYYMQFVPVLQQFQETVRRSGHANAALRMGEDVCQIDMVACASPHWNRGFLGGTDESIATIVDNCVSHNAWAMKQMVQTRPAILYIVSQSSWNMFRGAFGTHVRRDPPISEKPVDNDYTLLRETTDPAHPAHIEFDVTIDGRQYKSRTRLVITPHFSYNDNFTPQYRIGQADWKILQQTQAACLAALTSVNGFTIVPPDPQYASDYVAVMLSTDPAKGAAALAWLNQQFPAGYQALQPFYYDPHAMMASVLDEMYATGTLSWKDKGDGTGYLDRTEGSCRFCVNRHWQFPNECRYDKTHEEPPPPGFLEKVAERIAATGKPAPLPVHTAASLGVNPPPPPEPPSPPELPPQKQSPPPPEPAK
jgi:nucleoside phosphorylase